MLTMRFAEGLKGKEVAARLARDPGRISHRLKEAVQALHEQLLMAAEAVGQQRATLECLELYQEDQNWRRFVELFCDTLRRIGTEAEPEDDQEPRMIRNCRMMKNSRMIARRTNREQRTRDTLFLELFRLAADAQPIPDSGHVTDDDEPLACWAQGLLSRRNTTS